MRTVVVAVLAVGVAVGAPLTTAAGGSGSGSGKRDLEVMTQNLYLGSSLTPALAATTPGQFVAGVAQIYGTVVGTDFPRRAEAIADEILAERPDLIGLQEVSNWVATANQPAARPPSFDFLQILSAELAERGLSYAVAAVSDNADIPPSPLIVPLIAPPFGCTTPVDCSLTFHDRDVILVNTATPGLRWSNPTSDNFDAQQLVNGPLGTLSFDRGWAAIDATFDGARFRFVTTHLEVEDYPAVQEAQARELIAGPLKTLRPVIAVGDFNSAADGSTTRTYRLLVKALFADAWWTTRGDPGPTCCQSERLDNVTSALDARIDLVLTRLALPTSAHRVGVEPLAGPPPLWPSDHAGVVATVRLF
jgi:endonuclease/exonuclease/phosphatase family metal-dependent hydrolase